MSDFSINLTRANPPENTVGSQASATSTLWGRVYRNYISVNLKSEYLAKGAYDAYNLLTTNKLSDIVGSTFTYIQEVEKNVQNMATSVATRVSTESNRIDTITEGLNKLFSSNNPSSTADATPINQAKNKLMFPITDTDGTTVYDLSYPRKIPLASRNSKDGSTVPGFIKGLRAAQLDELMGYFTSKPLNSFYSDSPENQITLGTNNQPAQVLIYQVNQLQKQVEHLREQFNTFLRNSGDATFSMNTLFVKQIRFVNTDPKQVTIGGDLTKAMYLDGNIFNMPF